MKKKIGIFLVFVVLGMYFFACAAEAAERDVKKFSSQVSIGAVSDKKLIQGEPIMEVGIASGVKEALVMGTADFDVEVGGRKWKSFSKGKSIVITRKGKDLWAEGKKLAGEVYLRSGRKECTFVFKGNRYRGAMKLIPDLEGNGVTVVNVVGMEEYLQGVVPCEVMSSWHYEAIKAQAVAARTYALFHKNGFRTAGYDVTSDTRSQVYRGCGAETEATNRAVRETKGEIITYKNKVIDALFHGNGGGYTENSENVWGTVFPYLRGVKEEKGKTVNQPWNRSISISSFAKILSDGGYGVGQLKSLKLSALHIGERHTKPDRGVSGRVKQIEIKGTKGTKQVPGTAVQAMLGLPGTLFDIHAKGKNFVITGYGAGHGLGLSQWGAETMAENHKNEKDYYKKILTHYFTGVDIKKFY